MNNQKEVELTREGKAQRLAEDIIAAALHLVGLRERWIQKRVILLTKDPCGREFRFEIQLASQEVIAECLVNGEEDNGNETKDIHGNKTAWNFGIVEFKNLERIYKFRGWPLPNGVIYIEAIRRLIWGYSEKHPGQICVGLDYSMFPMNSCFHARLGGEDRSIGIGPSLGEALADHLQSYPSDLCLELEEGIFGTE